MYGTQDCLLPKCKDTPGRNTHSESCTIVPVQLYEWCFPHYQVKLMNYLIQG